MKNIIQAVALAKQEFKQIPKNSYNPYHKSKYANLDAVLEAISEALNKYDLCLIQPTEAKDNRSILKTIIYHTKSGEQISSELLLPQDAEPQKTGSAITYYRRYTLCSLLGIVADEDDDAELIRTVSPTMQSRQVPNQSRPQNIPYNDEEEKAKIIYAEMKKANLSPEVVLKIALTKFNSTNIRSLSWEQINQLKIYIQSVVVNQPSTEDKKSQLTLNNHSVK